MLLILSGAGTGVCGRSPSAWPRLPHGEFGDSAALGGTRCRTGTVLTGLALPAWTNGGPVRPPSLRIGVVFDCVTLTSENTERRRVDNTFEPMLLVTVTCGRAFGQSGGHVHMADSCRGFSGRFGGRLAVADGDGIRRSISRSPGTWPRHICLAGI